MKRKKTNIEEVHKQARVGAPSVYSEELAETILQCVAEGKSLRQIQAIPGMPAMTTIMRWLTEPAKAEFREQYELAKAMMADILFEDIMEIADNSPGDILGNGQPNSSAVQRSRLQVDARKWIVSKLLPKKYGDRIAMEHGNPDGSSLAPPVFQINFVKSNGDGGED